MRRVELLRAPLAEPRTQIDWHNHLTLRCQHFKATYFWDTLDSVSLLYPHNGWFCRGGDLAALHEGLAGRQHLIRTESLIFKAQTDAWKCLLCHIDRVRDSVQLNWPWLDAQQIVPVLRRWRPLFTLEMNIANDWKSMHVTVLVGPVLAHLLLLCQDGFFMLLQINYVVTHTSFFLPFPFPWVFCHETYIFEARIWWIVDFCSVKYLLCLTQTMLQGLRTIAEVLLLTVFFTALIWVFFLFHSFN